MKIRNVVCGTLWDNVMDTLQRENTYGWKEVKDKPGLSACLFEKDWLTNIINRYDVKQLTANTPVVIISQTGTGKTTHVFETLLPVAVEEEKKIMYLSGRMLLTCQMKKRCMSDEVNGKQKVHGIAVKDFPYYYTEKGLRNMENYGGIDVYSYQSFLHKHKEINPDKYAFVVLDECHFFLSDASFNVYTEEILDLILEKFSDVRRIYLTATPQECLGQIYYREMETLLNTNHLRWLQPQMKVYVMQENYSYLLPYFFNTTNYIIDKIKRSSEHDNWLIFVRDKNTGEKLVSELAQVTGGVLFINAESEKDDEEYLKLVNMEILPKRVLVSTKVLDVGVNVRTENLHMVVFENSLVEIKQMIGRKRIQEGEQLEVYFHIPDMKQLQKRKGQAERRYHEAKHNICNKDLLEYGYEIDLSKSFPLYYHKGIKANNFSISKLNMDCRYYENLCDNLVECQGKEEYMSAYAGILLCNFEGQVFRKEMLLEIQEQSVETATKKIAVQNLMRDWIGKTIDKDQLETFSIKLTEIIGDCRKSKRSDRGWMKYETLKEVLPEYGYSINNSQSTPVTYRITVVNESEV